jgi:malate dehydrogenase (oxaloacetate-decarboxylating)
VVRDGQRVPIDQTNNSYIFPGLALGVVASKAGRVTDAMIMAAARELAQLAPTRRDPSASLLPPLADARQLSRAIGLAVGRQAIRDGHALIGDDAQLHDELDANIWDPVYVPYERRIVPWGAR